MPAVAQTVDEGILGLEGIWNIAGYTEINFPGPGLPRTKLDRITGLHSLPDLDDLRDSKYGQGGEQVYVTNNRGRTITFEGRCMGYSLASMRNEMHQLRYALSHARQTQNDFIVRPNTSVGGVTWMFDARCLSFEADDEQTRAMTAVPTPWQRSFIFTLRQGDPRYYLVDQDVVVSGSPGQIITVWNPGNANTEPTFTVNGPIDGDLIFRRVAASGERVQKYNDVELASGQQLSLNFKNRTFRRVSDNEDYEYLRDFAESDWWDASAAGLNTQWNDVTVNLGNWSMRFTPAGW